MKGLNWVFGWFGYEWVKDSRPYKNEGDAVQDEGWDDLYRHTPRYRLRKKPKPKSR